MVVRRVIIPHHCITLDQARLTGSIYHYLCHVLRLKVGEQLILVDNWGTRYSSQIRQITSTEVICDIESQEVLSPVSRSGTQLTLIYGLARKARTELVWQKATELGVDKIIPVICQRSISRPEQTAHKQGRWQEIIKQAARQSGRASLPELLPPSPWAIALSQLSPDAVRLIAHCDCPPLQNYQPLLEAMPAEVILAIGPEGGFTPEEVAQAESQQFNPVSLGPLVLRTETAAIAFLTLAAYLSKRWAPLMPITDSTSCISE